jgi:hypothetical protein
MAMELLPFHNQFVAHFAADDQNDDLVRLDIIQGSQVTCPQLEVSERIRTQSLDRFRWLRGLVLQSGLNRCFQDALLTRWQRSVLTIGILGDRDAKRHEAPSRALFKTKVQACVLRSKGVCLVPALLRHQL